MQTIVSGARRVGSDYWSIVRADPGQVKFTPSWLRARKASTMDLRVPWLPFRVMERLEQKLDRTSKVAEFGGGGSTLWFADRVGEVVTIEHDQEWFPILERALADLPGCTLEFHSADDAYADYVPALDRFPDGYFDVVVVDGRERVRCFEAAIPKVAPGGLLILDDTERDRYRPAFEAVDWPRVTYRGFAPTQSLPAQSTVWERPAGG